MQFFYSEVLKLTQLLLVMPATNAVSKRTFSGMCVITTRIENTQNTKYIDLIVPYCFMYTSTGLTGLTF